MSNASIQTDPNQLTKVPAQISIWDGKQWLEISNQQTINTINENVGIAQKTADGKNSITWGTEQPSSAINGDIWLKKDENGNYTIQVYNGSDWDSPVEANVDAVKAQVAALPQNYYSATQPSGTNFTDGSHWYEQTGTDSNGNPIYTVHLWNSSTNTWNKMLNSGEVDNANQISQVKSGLTQAQSDIATSKNNITTLSSNLESAKTDLQNQVTDAKNDITTAQSNISQAQNDITTAQNNIKTNADAISDANGNISSLQKTASTLESDMTDAQGDISTLQQSATGFKTDIADNKGNISSLSGTVEGLSNTVSNNSGNITTLQTRANGFDVSVGQLQNNSFDTTKSYAGLSINSNGLTQVAGSTSVYLSNTHGFEIQKSGSDIFHVDTSGNLTMQGNITAGNISGVNFTGNSLTLAGTLAVTGSISADNGNVVINSSGLTIKGANLTIGDSSGNTTTYIKSDGTFITNKGVFTGSVTSSNAIITGGKLTVGSNFSVDTSGNLIASNAAITGSLYVSETGNQTWIDANGIHNTNGGGSDTYIKNGSLYCDWVDSDGVTNQTQISNNVIAVGYKTASIGLFNSRQNSPELMFSNLSGNNAHIVFGDSLGIVSDNNINLTPASGYTTNINSTLNLEYGLNYTGSGEFNVTSTGNINLKPTSSLGLFGNYIMVQSTGSVHLQSSSSSRVYIGHSGGEMSTDGGSLYNSSTNGWYMRDNSGNMTTVHGTSFVNSSLLSMKTNISKIDPATALDKINQTNIYDYQYKSDVERGSAKHYASYIIDDVNEVSQYTEPSEFLSEDKKGRDDGTQLAYLTAAVQYLAQKVKELESK
ncbi:tail fiber domain-containing protein [Liquorilactobacillus nagelii]|uniref:tail fiber domain-containing protein n=1 Tax=Liquorilactobacillus nagelii TaxID=82688 RepID=UPI0039E9DAEF